MLIKMKQKKCNRGQGMTEYLVIVALIAISSITILKSTSNSVKVGFAKIASSLQGKESKKFKADAVTQAQIKKRDMGNFAFDSAE